MVAWRGLVACGFGALLVLAGSCASDPEGRACAPGRSESCACSDGQLGAQICEPDGKGFASCVCDGAGGDGGATGSAGGPGSSPGDVAGQATTEAGASGVAGGAAGPGPAAGEALLGEPCGEAADCESGVCQRVLGQVGSVCVADSADCAYVDGNQLELTSATGPCAGEHSLWRCVAGEWQERVCDDLAPVCDDGACGVCRPGAVDCVGSNGVIGQCRADASGYDLFKDCSSSFITCAPSNLN